MATHLTFPGRRLRASALAVTVLLGLATGQACAASAQTSSSAARSRSACADLVAHALSVPERTPGAWACLDASLQNRMHAFGIDGDGGLAFIPFQSSRRSETYLGRTPDGGYVYWFQGVNRDGVLVIWLDKRGRVAAFNSGIHPDWAEQGPSEAQPVRGL